VRFSRVILPTATARRALTSSNHRTLGSPPFVARDGIERITTEAVFEFLEVPRLRRTPEAAKTLKRVMMELGWTPVRARAVTARGRAARVRGYARDTRGR
jgi:hypothetical protein